MSQGAPHNQTSNTPTQDNASVYSGYLLDQRYEMIQSIAYGGMAQVWVATDTQTNKSVAIKVLHSHLANDEKFITRFKREAQAASQLSHPSIVKILNSVSENGIEAIVMELIEGATLRDALDEEGALPPKQVIEIGTKISQALHVAHEAGIIHRDLKPANIMLGTNKQTYITDFGIAKATEDTDLTATGMLLGTAKYLAPEQVTGNNADKRSDIYSLGVVLFEAFTGKPPFEANTEAATALARLQTPPPAISSLKPELLGEIDHVMSKTLEREPAKRYQHAQELEKALTGIDPSRIGQRMPKPYEPQAQTSKSNNSLLHHSKKAAQPEIISAASGPFSTNWVLPSIALGVILASLILAIFLLVRSINQLRSEDEPNSITIQQVEDNSPSSG